MKKSLYGQYIEEREGKNIIESEYGFITLQNLEKTCYLIDIYVVPEKRKTGEARRLGQLAEKCARDSGYTSVITTVVPTAPYCTENIRMLINDKWTVYHSENNIIYLKKEL